MNSLYFLKVTVVLVTCFGLLTACKVESTGEAPSGSSSETPGTNPALNSYDIAFYNNLISAGMSSSDAEFVSGYSPNSGLGQKMVVSNISILASETGEKAKVSVAQAMAAVANSSHFPTALDKQNAVEKIANAQIVTVAEFVEDSQMAAVINEVAGYVVSDVDQTGLVGSDLKQGLKVQGEGIAKGILNASVDMSIHDEMAGEFSKGAVDGLLNNPLLNSSVVDLIGALTEGFVSELGTDASNVHNGEGKGLIIKELLNGLKNQINGNSNVSDNEKENFVADVWDKANSPIININDSNFLGAIENGIFNENSEVHVVSVYQAGSSSGWVTGPGGEMVSSHWDGNATVNISTGIKPVILVLTSYEGVNWHLTGATERVAKVIMHGYYDQFVDAVSPSIVEKYSYESANGYFYGISSGGNWFYNSDQFWTKAFLVKVRQLTKSKISTFQGAYSQTSFNVGVGLGNSVSLPAISFARPWLYCNTTQLTAYDTAGAPSIVASFYLTHKLTNSVSVRVWVENLTTSSADIPPFDHTYTINAGSSNFMAVIPFNQDGSSDGQENFRVHVEPQENVLNVQPIVNGLIY